MRAAARLILIDPLGRLLLFLHEDERGRCFWATPGGGVESGETVDGAARREGVEELGIDNLRLTELWTGQAELVLGDRRISQRETFFRVDGFSPAPGSDVARYHRVEGIREARWWSLSELTVTDETIFPADLAARLREHRAGVRK
jgi:8-oxo-dGTP pyrophosphatase MutT (NUDIX family)